MAHFLSAPTNGEPTKALYRLLSDLLERNVVEAVLVPARQPQGGTIMPTLISDNSLMDRAEPLAPVVWTNAGTLVSSLTFKSDGAPIAAVLRSCELRAFVERTKLNQGSRDNVLLIGVDCLGRFENRDYLKLRRSSDELTCVLLKRSDENADANGFVDGVSVAKACTICEFPVAPNADVRVCLIGGEPAQRLWLEAATEAGKKALSAIGQVTDQPMPGRAEAVAALEKKRVDARDAIFAEYEANTNDVDGLMKATAGCINCYNCRVACPLCYCRACVFTTELFQHGQAKYLKWSRKKGILKMPTDTAFYHLTRMVHMSTLCVGCGQCSSACPNDIDVMELFRTTARVTQSRFDYVPGRAFDEKQPLATFHEDELQDAGLGT